MATNKRISSPPAGEILDEVVKCVFTSCTATVKIRDLSKHLLTSGKGKHISSYKGSEVRDLIVKLSDYVVQLESERKQTSSTLELELERQDKVPSDATPRDVMLMMLEHKRELEQKIIQEHEAILEELQSIEMAIDDSRNSSLFQKLGITSSDYIKDLRAEIRSEKQAYQRLRKEKEANEQQLQTLQKTITGLEESKQELEKKNQALLKEKVQIQQKNAEKESANQAYQHLRKEKEAIEQQLRKQQQNITTLEEAKKELEMKNKTLLLEKAQAQKEISGSKHTQKRTERESEKQAYQRLRKEKETIEQQLQTQQQHIRAIEETTKELQKENKALKTKIRAPEDAEKEIRRLKEQLTEVQRRRYGHQVIGGVEHAHLSASYNSLFSKDWQKAYDFLTATRQMGKMQARWFIGAMFEKSYKAYKEHIFSTLFDDIFKPNSSGRRDLKAVKSKADAYGDLIHQFSDLKNPSQVQDMVIQNHLPSEWRALLMSGGRTSPVMAFFQKAVELSWQMLTIHPPMIVSTPTEFNEDIHERHPSHWDDDLEDEGKFELLYFRPVLYTSYEEVSPEKKGQVGTRPVQSI